MDMEDAEQVSFNGSRLDDTGVFPTKTKKLEKLSLCTAQYASQHFSWDVAAMYCFFKPVLKLVSNVTTLKLGEPGKSARAIFKYLGSPGHST